MTEFSSRTPLAIKRGSRRVRMSVSASLLTAAGTIEVRLRDLSRAGALAEAVRPPAVASEVVMVCGQLVAPAKIIWVIGRRLGLEFHEFLSEDEVAAPTRSGKLG